SFLLRLAHPFSYARDRSASQPVDLAGCVRWGATCHDATSYGAHEFLGGTEEKAWPAGRESGSSRLRRRPTAKATVLCRCLPSAAAAKSTTITSTACFQKAAGQRSASWPASLAIHAIRILCATSSCCRNSIAWS